jgi:hypothetical protein
VVRAPSTTSRNRAARGPGVSAVGTDCGGLGDRISFTAGSAIVDIAEGMLQERWWRGDLKMVIVFTSPRFAIPNRAWNLARGWLLVQIRVAASA